MITMKFCESQLIPVRSWLDVMVQIYLQHRYQRAWRWYWHNWEINNELLL